MNVNYLLSCFGSPLIPIMEIALPSDTEERAKAYATGLIEQLATCRKWTRFELFDVRENHHRVASYGVEIPVPVVYEMEGR